MSYRECRIFVDSLRSLGFKEPLSESSFLRPNFELLADILDFLCLTLDPRCQLPDDIATENDRVLFVKKALVCILTRTGLKLNPKLLYQADLFAIKEILKILFFLTPSTTTTTTTTTTLSTASTTSSHHKLLESSGNLFRLLVNKPDFVVSDQISDLSVLTSADQAHLTAADLALADLDVQESRLASLVLKRRAELDRTSRRLAAIKTVRPAFLDEYRQLEQEISDLYAAYVEKFRVLDFAEHQLDLVNLAEQRKLDAREAAVALANKKLREDEWRAMRGESSATTALPPSGRTSAQPLPVDDEVSIDEDDGESHKDDLYEVDDDNDDF